MERNPKIRVRLDAFELSELRFALDDQADRLKKSTRIEAEWPGCELRGAQRMILLRDKFNHARESLLKRCNHE